VALAAASVSALAAVAGDDVPAWLRQAAASSAPTYEKDVPAVVLHDESIVTIGDDGRITTVNTFAVRVLTREGRAYADAVEHYDADSGGKVREMRAWLVRPDGSIKKYGKDETLDLATDLEQVYNETRKRVISAEDDADVGAVFGYQAVTEERPFFPQNVWAFQSRLPTLVSRFTMTLPAGWRASSVTFNAAKVEPTVTGSSYTWEMRNLQPIAPEVASPSVATLAPRVAVSYGSATPTAARSFDTWVDVSRWYAELSDAQSEPDDAIATKARALTANAKTELEKIRAIGSYVQNLQYISIQIGIGGYRPHSAREVFAKQYGDCKDKANLMRAMLKAVKIDSYLILIRADDRSFVREEWPSPTQFNHCIIAVRVGDETNASAIVQHASLGRLLIFDATDDSTPVGDLPDDEQGSFALVAAGDKGALIRMPVIPSEGNRTDREVELGLTADGSITAIVRERTIGQAAAQERRMFKGLKRGDYAKIIERWAGRGATGAKFTKIEPTDNQVEGRFALDVEFTADRYAQTMQDRLLVFQPAVVSRTGTGWLADPKRKHSIMLEGTAFTETVRVKLPAGFDVDEMPDAVKISSEFGTYSATYEMKDGQLVFTRSLVQRAATIPVEKYGDVRTFFGRVRASEEAPIVLARK
ncbi:MAG: DUF3857 domain-containing protein, partial [Rubrivivax sp.]|nr:DUF3857 domain-containing protein [Pyrinomonadaceae bacterium]